MFNSPGYKGEFCESEITTCSESGSICPEGLFCMNGECHAMTTPIDIIEDLPTAAGAGNGPCGHLNNPCRNNATCQDMNGTAACECLSGYEGTKNKIHLIKFETDWKILITLILYLGTDCGSDIDECVKTPDICNHGICQNTNGKFCFICVV